MPTSTVATRDVALSSWRLSRNEITLLLQMAREADELAEQAARLHQLKKQARGVTYAQIAAAVGRTERQVQRWFAGDSDIDAAILPKLARFLGSTPDFIEYGVMKRSRRANPTPDLSRDGNGNGSPDRLKKLEELVSALDEQVRFLRVETATRDAEALTRIEEGFLTIQESLRQRPQ